jgi:hypothetical protein
VLLAFAIAYVADEPAATVCDVGVELRTGTMTFKVNGCVAFGLIPFCAVNVTE